MLGKYTYLFTPLAEADIDSALAYITEELCNVKAAGDLFAKIEKTIDTVCAFPFSSADCECFLITDGNIRHVLIDNYCLIYEVKEDERQIIFLRFRYARTDMTKLALK